MRKGAANFLEKPFGEDALVDAIRAALAPARNNGAVGAVGECMARLSPRERQVLDLVVARKPNKIIADLLGISIKTVELHPPTTMTKHRLRPLPAQMKVTMATQTGRAAWKAKRR